ncbi:tetrathionate reductase subunit A [Salmonella enterica subsp. enterica]|uniref:Tetrathionate reductase subunit A n=1 Tax=Salmonella enterica I TaxID=59201 RepID=A0A379WUI9_SALET|nr:tetrathionate reductase subunit A [Salmonella enterica subsp. enterica]
MSQEHPIDSSVPFSEAMEQLAGESGLDARSTACARGATLLESLYSPLRLLEPMKRVGKRGEGKWQRISFEQLIEEVVEGGDLFGEGHVDGLRAIHAPDTQLTQSTPVSDQNQSVTGHEYQRRRPRCVSASFCAK